MNARSEEERFFVLPGGLHPWTGPHSRADLDGRIGAEALTDADFVWSTKHGSWQPAHQFLATKISVPALPTPAARQVGPSLGDVIRRMAIGSTAIAFSFWGLCWLSLPPTELEIDPVVRFDLEDDFDIPLNAIDAGMIDNTVEPLSTPDASPSPGEGWTENSS